MSHDVQFPGLGIAVTVNETAFSIGGFQVKWYGIIIAVGFLLALIYVYRSSKKMNIDMDRMFDAIIVGLIGSVVCARLFYVIFFPGDKYMKNPMEIFRIHEGGLAIYGAVIGALVFGGITAKLRRMNVFAVLDVAALGFLIGQGVGRWGNFVNQEAFGTATDLPWGMYSDNTAREVVGNVHPCFLYESLLCLLGFVLLHFFTRKFRRYDGQTFLLYVVWYGVVRFFIEGLRTDSLLIPYVDLRVSQVIAGATALVGIVILFLFRRCTRLSGCGDRRVMEAVGLTISEDMLEELDVDESSTIFADISVKEALEKVQGTEAAAEKETAVPAENTSAEADAQQEAAPDAEEEKNAEATSSDKKDD